MKEANFYFEVLAIYEDEENIECGFVPADNFTEAMNIIETYFGQQLCCVNRLEWTDCGLITMPKDVAQVVYNRNF